VAAKAVLWAAVHYRREYVVGFPAWKAIYGNNFFPSLGDKYLAKKGYDSQQTGEVKSPDQADNLFTSVPGPFGAHGRFDHRALERDSFFELTKHVSFNYMLIGIVILIALLFIL
jgi:hypothetical protein